MKRNKGLKKEEEKRKKKEKEETINFLSGASENKATGTRAKITIFHEFTDDSVITTREP